MTGFYLRGTLFLNVLKIFGPKKIFAPLCHASKNVMETSFSFIPPENIRKSDFLMFSRVIDGKSGLHTFLQAWLKGMEKTRTQSFYILLGHLKTNMFKGTVLQII